MDPKLAYKRFVQQKRRAKERGVGWELTFYQWCEWWGEDIVRRGCRHDQLSMQRIGDVGPYALWNIRKGTPSDNARTKGKMQRKNNTDAAAELLDFLQRALKPKVDYGPHDDMSLSEDERHFANVGRLRSCTERYRNHRD